MQIWNAGTSEDFKVVTAETGEPIISTMGLAQEASEEELSFRPSASSELSAYQLWQVQNQRAILRKEYLDYWQNTVSLTGTGRPVDAIICPGAPFAAPPHGLNK